MTRPGLGVWIIVLVGCLWGCMIGASGPGSTSTPQPISPDTPRPTATLFDAARLPPVTPVTERAPRRCPRAPRSHLIVHERGQVTNNGKSLNIRSLAGTDAQQIGQMPAGAIFFVIGGPRCEGDFVWFYILYQGMEGWIAEADDEMIFAQPYQDG